MTFYSDLATDANEILREFGAPVALTRKTGAYDKTTRTVTAGGSVTNGTGVVFDFNLMQAGQQFAPGTAIEAGDKQMLLSALDTSGMPIASPKPGDTVTFAAIVWNVAGVKELAPAGEAVMYELLLRR